MSTARFRPLSLVLSALAAFGAMFALNLLWQARRSHDLAPALDLDAIVSSGRLPDCPETPTCVSSQAGDPEHAIEPFAVDLSRESTRGALERLVASARAEGGAVVTRREGFAHLTFRTPRLGFVDDVLLLAVDERSDDGDRSRNTGRIDVHSASRVGSSDFGANRERVEALRRRYDLG